MKSKILNILNVIMVGILAVLIILYFTAKVKNKENEKVMWTAEIRSFSENSTSSNPNIIKVVDGIFYNTFNNSTKKIDSDSKDLTSSSSRESIYFQKNTELLPDSLNLKYFSVDERKFYQLQTKIPYDLMRNAESKIANLTKLSCEMYPKGKVILKIDQEDLPSINIASYRAKETTGNLDQLIYKESLGEKHNDYEGIENINDFSDLLQNQYRWIFKVDLEDGDQLLNAYAYSFAEQNIFDLKEKSLNEFENIPKSFYVRFGNVNQYGIDYYFNALEILNAFRKLDKINGPEPITLTFKLFKNKPAECELSKNGQIISIKDLHPENPRKYVD